MTRAMGHSPNGQDAKRLEAEPEWPGPEGMRPISAFFDDLGRPTAAVIWLDNVSRQLGKEGGK